MATCVVVNASGSVVSADPQPGDLSSCEFVLMTPSEFSQASQVFDSSLASEFFGFGFFMVVASFLGGWAVGSVLKIVRRGH